MMSVHLKTFWTLFQIITEHYKALVASPQTDHYFAWCSVLFVPTIVICHWEATRRRAKKNQDKIYGAAGRRSVLTMLLRKSDKNIKLWLNICILSWLEIHILSLLRLKILLQAICPWNLLLSINLFFKRSFLRILLVLISPVTMVLNLLPLVTISYLLRVCLIFPQLISIPEIQQTWERKPIE